MYPNDLFFYRSGQGSSRDSPRRTPASPRWDMRQSSETPPPDALMSDESLLAKLSDVAMVQDAAAQRRMRFKNRDDWRIRTMPITEEEVHEADG